MTGFELVGNSALFIVGILVLAATALFWFIRISRGSMATLVIGAGTSAAIIIVGAIVGAFLLGGAML